jgi:hypothetical protein
MNPITILVLIILQQALGFLWYSPWLFGNRWLAGIHQSPEELNRKDPAPFITAFVGSIFYTCVLAWLLEATGTEQMLGALELGFLAWLGLMLPTIATHYKFQGFGWGLIVIDAGKDLASTMMTVVILMLWH